MIDIAVIEIMSISHSTNTLIYSELKILVYIKQLGQVDIKWDCEKLVLHYCSAGYVLFTSLSDICYLSHLTTRAHSKHPRFDDFYLVFDAYRDLANKIKATKIVNDVSKVPVSANMSLQ